MGAMVEITQEQRELVKTMAAEGKEDFTIARALNVTKRMLMYRCQKELAWGRGVAIQNGIVLPSKHRRVDKRADISDETIFQIETLAGYGLPMEQIAYVVGMSKQALQAYCLEDIERGRANSHTKVAKALYEMAVDKNHPLQTQFYLKSKCGWKETTSIEFPDEDGKPQQVGGNTMNISVENMQAIIEILNEKV